MTETADKGPLRRDARLNRDRLIAVAREIFEEEGLDAPLDGIARSAGVGQGTLYRHFPTREDLVEAIFVDTLNHYIEPLQMALTKDDAWAALVEFMETTLEPFDRERLTREIYVRYPPGGPESFEVRMRMYELMAELVARAQEQGTLRADFGVNDLMILFWSFAPVIDATAEALPTAWRRHLHFLIDGLRAESATPQTSPALDPEQYELAMAKRRDALLNRRG